MADTDATDLLLEEKVLAAVTSARLPSDFWAVTFSCRVVPSRTAMVVGVTEIEVVVARAAGLVTGGLLVCGPVPVVVATAVRAGIWAVEDSGGVRVGVVRVGVVRVGVVGVFVLGVRAGAVCAAVL